MIVSPNGTPQTEREEYDDDGGAQARTNEHVNTLVRVLLTYGFYEKELGMWPGTHLAFHNCNLD